MLQSTTSYTSWFFFPSSKTSLFESRMLGGSGGSATGGGCSWSLTKTITKGGTWGQGWGLVFVKLLSPPQLSPSSRFYSACSHNFCKSHKKVFFQASAPKLFIFHGQQMCGCRDRGRGEETKYEGGRCCCGLKSSFFQLYFKMGCWNINAQFVFLLGWLDSLSLARAKNWKCFCSLQKRVKKAFGNIAT